MNSKKREAKRDIPPCIPYREKGREKKLVLVLIAQVYRARARVRDAIRAG